MEKLLSELVANLVPSPTPECGQVAICIETVIGVIFLCLEATPSILPGLSRIKIPIFSGLFDSIELVVLVGKPLCSWFGNGGSILWIKLGRHPCDVAVE